MVKMILIGIGVLVAAVVGVVLVGAMIWPRINDVRTGATPEYPDVQPQQFNQGRERVFDAALATAQAMGWKITQNDRARGEIRAVAATPVLQFKDDVTITIAAAGGNVTVDVRSRSRIGRGDFGANARRIRQFQAALEARVAAGSA